MYAQFNRVAQKYITYVLDVIKMTLYKHVKVAIPEDISLNKIIVLGQYCTKLDKVISSVVPSDSAFSRQSHETRTNIATG